MNHSAPVKVTSSAAIPLHSSAKDKHSQSLLRRVEERLQGVLIGKQHTIRQVLVGLLAGGHLLIEDVPGVGKTMLVSAIARLLGGSYHRIQFTSDLMPADIVGGMIYDPHDKGLTYREGPIMANVILADELNRASTRTQSALLEALEHRSVSIEGTTYPLPEPFIFIATQNPLSYQGTNPLLEAQLDRFTMQLSIGYPDQQAERQLLMQFASESRVDADQLRPVFMPTEWLQMLKEVAQVYVHPDLMHYMTDVANATRNHPSLSLGVSTRALRDWLRVAQASAYIQGRGFTLPDDLIANAAPVLSHRIVLKQQISSQPAKHEIIDELISSIPISSSIKERAK